MPLNRLYPLGSKRGGWENWQVRSTCNDGLARGVVGGGWGCSRLSGHGAAKIFNRDVLTKELVD